MNNFNFLKKYYKLQQDIMFDEPFDLDFGLVAYSRTDKDEFWNNILVNNILEDSEIEIVEKKLEELKRKSAIYFENNEFLSELKEKLSTRGYTEEWKDAWMFWQNNEIDNSRFDEIKKVENEEDLKVFLDIFDKSFQENDPQNPYGELGDYLKASESVWHKHNKTNRLEYFIAYKEGKPVAVSTLTNFDGIGYISNVGSLQDVRGQGYGKLATLYCVEQSKKNKNTEHCIATEEETYPNEFYKRIGFKTRFTAVGYVKK